MKILFLSHKFYPDIGGIEIASEILATSYCNAGHEVHLVTWSQDLTQKQFPFRVIRKPSWIKLFKEQIWAELVFENNPCLRLSWLNLFFNKPSVISLQTWISGADGKIRWRDRLKYAWVRRAQKVVACSEAIRKRCCPSATVIENPYDDKIFKVVPHIEKVKSFVFLGRLVSDKGADIAIRAFYEFMGLQGYDKTVTQKYSLTIIGQGPERERLESIVSHLMLEKKVVFTGPLSGTELVNCLNEHEFILIPSVWEEPFGIVVLEGMACGCIPIVSDTGGLPDAVGSAGLKFRRGDVSHLANCIQALNTDTILQGKLREAAKSHLAAHTKNIISDQYLHIINSFN